MKPVRCQRAPKKRGVGCAMTNVSLAALVVVGVVVVAVLLYLLLRRRL